MPTALITYGEFTQGDSGISRVLDRMKDILEERPRFGCPRVHLVLQSEGLVQNHKRTERIYYGNGLQLKKRKPFLQQLKGGLNQIRIL